MNLKSFNLLFLISASLLLFSCSQENPLEKNALSLSGSFLFYASYYSEKKLNSGYAHGGYDYGKCVEGEPGYSARYCQKLYKAIIEVAKKQNGLFKNITVNDLTEANAYYQVKGYYDNQTYIGISVVADPYQS